MHLRPERTADIDAIRALTVRAFDGHPHSDGSEPAIIDALRAAGALSLSLVAIRDDAVAGHVAVSPVDWAGEGDWYGLGPISVEPAHQQQGIGSALIRAALDHIRGRDAAGCVVAGDPAYYARFGFRQDRRFTYPGLPPDYFMVLPFAPVSGAGVARYHPAFG